MHDSPIGIPDRTLLDAAPDAMLVVDHGGEIVLVNRQMERLFGYTRDQLLGQCVEVLLPERFQDRHPLHRRHFGTAPRTRSMGVGPDLFGRRIDGTEFPVDISLSPIQTEKGLFVVGAIRDATLQHQQECNLLGILEASINEIYIFDAHDLHLIQVNRGARRNLGYSMEELSECTPLSFKPEFTAESFDQLLRPLRDGKGSITFSTTHRRKDGSDYPVEVHLQMAVFERVSVFVAIVQDVSERNRLKESLRQSQKLEALGQISSGIAHDFNNVLTIIAGNLEFLDQSGDEEDRQELIKDANQALHMGQGLTRRLLGFARRSELKPSLLDINEHVLNAEALLRPSCCKSNTLTTILTPELWKTLADPSEIENTVVNLVLNARDALPNGGCITIETANVNVDAEDDQAMVSELLPGDYVRLSVADTGTGMTPEVSARIFEPFFTTKGSQQGTGLGLASIYGFARQTGGHVSVCSEVGHGTTINVYLPRHRESKSEFENPPASATRSGSQAAHSVLAEEKP